MRGARGGASLLEILMASAVLSLAFLPIVASMHSMFRFSHRSQEATLGTFLVRAALENIRHRVHDAVGRDPQKVYEALGESLTPVVSEPGSRYVREFSSLDASPGITAESNPTLFGQLRAARIKVEVLPADAGSAAPLDADGDMRPEPDMCEVHVEVTWSDEKLGTRRQEAWTALTRLEARLLLGAEGR